MGKHKHSKDKMFITYSEMKQDWQGKKNKKKIPFSKLPFYCCALSLLPFQDPVCTTDGNVFDIYYIIPFIKKYHRCPITGRSLKPNQLIKMYWSKNQKDQFQDPISYKVFTEYTHIVCIKTSGYVYAFDTIQELNKKPKFYFDLITNEPFTSEDIITIQDPKDLSKRQVLEFDYLKNNIPFVPPEKLQPQIKENQTISRVMEQMNLKRQQKQSIKAEEMEKKKKQKIQLQARQDVKAFIQWCMQNKVYKHERETDYSGASLTSTSFTPSMKTTTSFRDLKQSEIRQKIYYIIKKQKMKGLVQMSTNKGNFNFLIHTDLVPKTGENFIQLTEEGYYNGTEFHRLVKDFCLQGGDPTGTGSGGQSIFGKSFEDEFNPKLKHKQGILSMANSGPCSNRSQFFICLSEQPSLDQKHTVFGEIISGQNLLYEINKSLASSKSQKPKSPIIIQKMICYDNPYRKVIKRLKKQYQSKIEITQQEKQEKEKERWIQDNNNIGSFKLSENNKKYENKKETKEDINKSEVKNKVLTGGFY